MMAEDTVSSGDGAGEPLSLRVLEDLAAGSKRQKARALDHLVERGESTEVLIGAVLVALGLVVAAV